MQHVHQQGGDQDRMTDGRSRTVDLTNVVIVMTSNIGAAEVPEAGEPRSIVFAQKHRSRTVAVQDAVMQAPRASLPPELCNWIDEVLFLKSLTHDGTREVARGQLTAVAASLREDRDVRHAWSWEGIDALLEGGGYDPGVVGRLAMQAIARLVDAPVAEMIHRDDLRPADELCVRGADDGAAKLPMR